ncbi:MAG: type II secretion system protein [Gammaproteobacteria bacterium]|nr:type II secretion system protein [Gammaproteobacteria bacterium]MBL7000336.1 type II secretion system protein [Gammaproteobacteria bacterium]
MKKSQSGFTLIELVVVIVLLGILGVTALGKFQDLSGNAEAAAIAGVASELSGSAAINFANSTLGNTGSVAVTNTSAGTTGAACGATLLNQFFASGVAPAAYTYTFGTTTATTNAACDAAGDTYTCALSKTGVTATPLATVVCTGG